MPGRFRKSSPLCSFIIPLPFHGVRDYECLFFAVLNLPMIEQYHSVFHLWEDAHKGCKLTDILEIHFLELPKFRKARPDLGKPLDRWLIFIEDLPKEVARVNARLSGNQ